MWFEWLRCYGIFPRRSRSVAIFVPPKFRNHGETFESVIGYLEEGAGAPRWSRPADRWPLRLCHPSVETAENVHHFCESGALQQAGRDCAAITAFAMNGYRLVQHRARRTSLHRIWHWASASTVQNFPDSVNKTWLPAIWPCLPFAIGGGRRALECASPFASTASNSTRASLRHLFRLTPLRCHASIPPSKIALPRARCPRA